MRQEAKHDIFARCPGDAMYPKICKGSLMALARLNQTDPIIDGEIYVIDTESQGLIIRKIRDNKDGTWTCIPCNQDQFKSFNIYRFDVINVFKVVGILTTNI